MKFILSVCLIALSAISAHAQHKLKLSIKNAEAKEPLAGATATIKSLNRTAIADSSGLVSFDNLKAGNYSIEISYVGHEEQEIDITVPQPSNQPFEVFLEEGEEHEEDVVVMATRTSRSIRDIPTRVETISGEELTEKGNMKPGDIRMLLNESTGIQTQQTSATSYNSSIRIQGLDGRYTQILRDGFPLYSGFAGGLSIMQIVPLDLKQVEVIKGSSSTLYGGGAIAGLVNLVSKTPTAKREISFMANATSAKGLDLSGFYSQRFNKVGVTVFGSRNTGSPYDPADIGLTAIPKFERYTINPRLFIYGEKTNANIGFSYITEDRIGGSMDYIKNGSQGYFEENNTDRFTTQFDINHKLDKHSSLNFKNSYSRFDRLIQIPDYAFKGLQQSTFSELTYNLKGENTQWVAGANLLTDDFAEDKIATSNLRDYHYNTFGGFIQNTWSPVSIFTLETGLRGDYVEQYGFELLPRISALFKISPKLTSRIGGGFGYKTPTVFNEESEKIQFQNILPIDQDLTRNERSVGGSFDVNYRAKLGEAGIAINQLFFYTRLNKPLILTSTSSGDLAFVNANGYIDTKGLETNLRVTYNDFKLFIGYTYADVASHFDGEESWFPLTARHRLNNVLMYEKEEKLKIGLEAYYFSPQKLSDGSIGKPYWTAGFMAEKMWEHFSVFVNFENFTDTRQTKFDTIYTGSINDPVFRDIYAPVDGFVINGGIKIKL
ncbi:TonB-dependent receptor [Chitinophagaceae bacterium LB-8]|uniref:TonB-dependent receptor n=1 Tax=Paraflavisolibacter caeni TaxID=2982496 RepID=A0A9X3BIV8_9BACT|nr:TonB-dependent receptor [Paraflavisolibacter caeni]MCU7550508.1 TonB-dependent receptor [Paraflavisolibacter caeni]